MVRKLHAVVAEAGQVEGDAAPPSISRDRKRRAHLMRRRDDLARDVEDGVLREAECVGHLDEARAQLAEGSGTGPDVRAVAKVLGETRENCAENEQGLAKVAAELAGVNQRIDAHDNDLERERQEKGSEPVRKRFEAAYEAAVQDAGAFEKALIDLHEIAVEYGRDFPMAWALPEIRLKQLVSDVCRARRWREGAAADFLVRSWLIGPDVHGVSDQRRALEAFGLKVR